MVLRRFDLAGNGTSVRKEATAGLTTFLTMAYIAFVNPSILSAAGMDFGAVFVATCLAAAIGSSIMGLWANYPIALAPGMGLNAYFTYGVVLGLGVSWQVALGAVFLSGLLFVALSLLPVREWIVNAIPRDLKLAIAAGIGLFLGLIGLKNAGIVVASPNTTVTLGDVTMWPAILAGVGFVAIVALDHRRVPGAIVLGILGTTVAGVALGVSEFQGIVAPPPDPSPTLLQLDVVGALQLGLVVIVFTLLLVDLFDTSGTLIAVAHQGRLLDERGRLPRLRRALLADSTATSAGALLGTSTTTSYIESAAGIRAGGRTGLTAVTVAILFLLCLFLAPLAQTVPDYATAPALLFVASLMAKGLADLDWGDVTEYAPAVAVTLTIPFTFSIADGIGIGFITYACIKLAAGKPRECPPAVAVIAVLFAAAFAHRFLG